MNTMKRALLGTSLLLLTASFGRLAHADGTYTPVCTGVSPQGGTYPITMVYEGSGSTPASIPIKVNQLSATVTGATPSRTIYVSWDLNVSLTFLTPGHDHGNIGLADDSSNGLIAVPTQPDGSFTHPFNGSGTYSQTYTTSMEADWTIYAGASITDPGGNNNVLVQGGSFKTVDQWSI